MNWLNVSSRACTPCVGQWSLYNEEFDIGIGVHQGSILVLEVLLHEFRTNVPWELLYADDLVLLADTQEGANGWKAGVVLHVIKKQVLGLQCKYLCTVRCSCVGNNFVECSQCKLWIHKMCSIVTKQLVTGANYICKARPTNGIKVTRVDVTSTMLDVETTLCYLGDMLCSGGGCDSAIAVRFLWPGESLWNSCLSSPQCTSRWKCVPRRMKPASTGLCSMVAKCGDQTPLNCWRSAAKWPHQGPPNLWH